MTNTGHGHVRPRPDGVKARCGGPGLCGECSAEGLLFNSDLWDVDPQALAAVPPDEVPLQVVVTVRGNCGVVHGSLAEWQACAACERPPIESPCIMCGSSPSFYPYCARAACPSRPGDDVPIAPICCGKQSDCATCPDIPSPWTGPAVSFAVAAPDIWMQALDGRAVDLVNPTPDMIDFRTIATVLARIPRFGGHTRNGPYSVAQHCIEGAHAIVRDGHSLLAAAAFLIHDAHEAYIGDVTTPVQKALAARAPSHLSWVVTESFRDMKLLLDRAIYPAAGLPWPLPQPIQAVLHEYDLRMMVTERDARLDPPPYPWTRDAERVAGVDVLSMREGTVAALYWAACVEMLPCRAGCVPRAKVPLSRNICGNSD